MTLSLLDVLAIAAGVALPGVVLWAAGVVLVAVFAAVLSLIDPSDGEGS